MGKSSNQRSTPNPKREKKKVVTEDSHYVQASPPRNLELFSEPMDVRAKRALQIITTIDENTNRFMRNWIGYNALYNAFSGNERTRLMACIENGVTDEQASRILASVDGELLYYAHTPPGNMRLRPTHPDFRKRTTLDLHDALDDGLPPVTRLAHLMAAVYQVRCNLFHGEKNPQSIRNQELLNKGSIIVETAIKMLIASVEP